MWARLDKADRRQAGVLPKMQTAELGRSEGEIKDGQTTKEGSVYFVETEDGLFVKIGYSIRPVQRLNQLGTLRPGNYALRLIGWLPGTLETERWLHAKFSADRDNGEWFRNSDRLRQFIAAIGLVEQLVHVPTLPTAPRGFRCSDDGKKNSAAVELGRKGGLARVPKGLATMSDEDRRRVQSAGGKASKRGPAKKKKAAKK